MALENHEDILRHIYRLGGGEAFGAPFPDVPLTKKMRRAIETARLTRGQTTAKGVENELFNWPTYGGRFGGGANWWSEAGEYKAPWRDLYNQLIQTQFGHHRNKAWQRYLIPRGGPVSYPVTNPVSVVDEPDAWDVTLRQMGWLDETGRFRRPMDLSGGVAISDAEDELRKFMSLGRSGQSRELTNILGQGTDIPSDVVNYAQELADVVREGYAGRYEGVVNQIVELDLKIKQIDLDLRNPALSYMEREQLMQEIASLRGGGIRVGKTRRLPSGRVINVTPKQTLTDLLVLKRSLEMDMGEIQSTIQRLNPAARDVITFDPIQSLGMDFRARSVAADRIAERNPELISQLDTVTRIEKEVKKSFRTEKYFLRNLGMSGDEVIADVGFYRGMPVMSRMVSRERFLDEGNGIIRALTSAEISGEVPIVDSQGHIFTKEEARARNMIKAGKAVQITPSQRVDFGPGTRFLVRDSATEEAQRLDYFRRMDKTLKSIDGANVRGSFKNQAVDQLSRDVSAKIGRGLGQTSGGYDVGALSDFVKKSYDAVNGSDDLTPGNLSKNLYLQLLYGTPKEQRQAHTVLNLLRRRKGFDAFSEQAFGALSYVLPGIEDDIPTLRRMRSSLEISAEEMHIPRTRAGFEAAAQTVEQRLIARDRMRRLIEKPRDVMDLSSWSEQEMEIVSRPTWGPEYLREQTARQMATTAQRDEELYARYQTRMRQLEGDLKRHRRSPTKRQRVLDKIEREKTAFERASSARDSTYGKLVHRSNLLETMSPERLATVEGLIDQAGSVEDFIYNQRLVHDYRAPFDEEGLRDVYEYIVKQRNSYQRASQVAKAGSARVQSSLMASILRHVTTDDLTAQTIAGTAVNPFEGHFDSVIGRLYQMADENTVIDMIDERGVSRSYQVDLLEQTGDRYDLSLIDESGQRSIQQLRWQQHQVNLEPFFDKDFAIPEQVGSDIRDLYRTMLAEREVDDDVAQMLLDQLDERVQRTLGSREIVNTIGDIVTERGSFVSEQTQQFMLLDAEKYYARIAGRVPAVGLGVGESVMRHMNLATSGFGIPGDIPGIMSSSLFELDRDNLPRLNRAFAPLVEGEGGALYRLDEVSDDARRAMEEIVDEIDRSLKQQGIDLAEVIRVSDEMAAVPDITSPGILSQFEVEPGKFGFRQRGGRLSPILGAGQLLETPLDLLKPGVLDDLPAGVELPPLKNSSLSTLGQAFGQALIHRQGSPMLAPDPDLSQRLVQGISDAIAHQWGILTSESVLHESPHLTEAIRPMLGPQKPAQFMVADAVAAPKLERMTAKGIGEFFGSTNTMRAALLGGGAFLAWGVVTSGRRKKDHANEQIPHLPGGSPYETPSGQTAAPYIQSAAMGGQQGGQLYYINARGSFDPAALQGQVASITGGSITGQINTRSDPLRSQRPTIEQRLS